MLEQLTITSTHRIHVVSTHRRRQLTFATDSGNLEKAVTRSGLAVLVSAALIVEVIAALGFEVVGGGSLGGED